MFGLPLEYFDQGMKRYGFHGLSYEFVASALPEYLGELSDGRVIVAHLSRSASLCAMQRRRSVATTMGFTALDGLLMGTRCGNIDPGVTLYLMSEKKLNSQQVTDLLYRRSGLLGVSGISADMRELLASDSERAAEAIELFVYGAARQLGGLIATLGERDALIFTGGSGTHSCHNLTGLWVNPVQPKNTFCHIQSVCRNLHFGFAVPQVVGIETPLWHINAVRSWSALLFNT